MKTETMALLVSAVAALISLGGVAYAAGTISTRVSANTDAIRSMKPMIERLVKIESDVSYLRAAEERRLRIADNYARRNGHNPRGEK